MCLHCNDVPAWGQLLGFGEQTRMHSFNIAVADVKLVPVQEFGAATETESGIERRDEHRGRR